LEHNVAHNSEIKRRQVEAFERRKSRMLKVEKNVELAFTKIYLSKEDILNHAGYRHLMSKVGRMVANVAHPKGTVYLVKSILRFHPVPEQALVVSFLANCESGLSRLSLQTVAELLRILAKLEKDAKLVGSVRGLI